MPRPAQEIISLLISCQEEMHPLAPVEDLINVRHLGAKGDGKTKDTKALQAAIDSASGNKSAVFVPPGDYLTRELHMRPATSLVRVKPTTSKIVFANLKSVLRAIQDSDATHPPQRRAGMLRDSPQRRHGLPRGRC